MSDIPRERELVRPLKCTRNRRYHTSVLTKTKMQCFKFLLVMEKTKQSKKRDLKGSQVAMNRLNNGGVWYFMQIHLET